MYTIIHWVYFVFPGVCPPPYLHPPPVMLHFFFGVSIFTSSFQVVLLHDDWLKFCFLSLSLVYDIYDQYCEDKFSVETVDVVYEESGEKQVTPLMSKRTEVALVSEICSVIGVEVSDTLSGRARVSGETVG